MLRFQLIKMKISVKLFYHLKEKAGTGNLVLEIRERSTIRDLKNILEQDFPQLRTQLDNVMVLMNQMIVLDEDFIKENSVISFLTPVGGG